MSTKFIIGLRTTVPSIRILKQPGGDSSDLFDLQTRQKAFLQSSKNKSCSLMNTKLQKLIDQSKNKYMNLDNTTKPETTLNTNMESRTINNIDDEKNCKISSLNNCSALKRSEGKENLLSQIQSSSVDTCGTSVSSSTSSPGSYVNEKKVKNVHSVPNFQSNSLDCDQTAQERLPKISSDINCGTITKKESSESNVNKLCKAESSKNQLSPKRNKKFNVDVKDMKENAFILNTKKHESVVKHMLGKTGTTEILQLKPNTTKQFQQNPITGAITEVQKNKFYKKFKGSRYSGLKSVNSYDSTLLMTYDGVVSSKKRVCPAFVRRNPITGENMKDDTNHFQFAPRGIRVIHPPGGISNGIF